MSDTVLYAVFAGDHGRGGGAWDFVGFYATERTAIAQCRASLDEGAYAWAHYMVVNGDRAGEVIEVLPKRG